MSRAYYQAHKEELAIKRKTLLGINGKEIRAKKRNYNENHKTEYRNNFLKRKYGIDIEDYGEMFKEQGGRCFICGEKRECLCVDHDHKTNKIRGLLCEHCNRMLGCVHDSVDILEIAIQYLKKEN